MTYRFLSLILFVAQVGCGVLKNDYDERTITCGVLPDKVGHYVKIFDPNGEPLAGSQVTGKVLESGVIVETIDFTSKGCFRAPDQGSVIIRSQDLKLSRSLSAMSLKATSKLILFEDNESLLLPSEPLKDRRTYFGQAFYFVDPGYVLNFYSDDNLKNFDIEYCIDEIADPETYDFNAVECTRPKYYFLENLPRLNQGLWSVRYRKRTNGEGIGWKHYLLAVRVECEGVLRDVENIAATRCTDIDNLEIKGAGNLEKLKHVSKVTGYLKIEDNDSRSLYGIRNISSVGDLWISGMSNLKSLDIPPLSIKGDIYISQNSVLEDVDGLSHLEKVERDFGFSENEALISIEGMRNIKSVGGSLMFYANTKLENVDGLRNLEHVGESLSFVFAESLQSIKALSNLRRVGSLMLSDDSLISLDGLENLERVDNTLELRDLKKDNLEVFSRLAFIGDELVIRGGNVATLHGFRNLKYAKSLSITDTRISKVDTFEGFERLDGSLILDSNSELISLEGLRNLTYVGGDVTVADNPLLEAIDAFGKIETIGYSLTIFNNAKLSSLDGLSNLRSAQNIFLEGNTALVRLDPIMDMEFVKGRIDISPFSLCQMSNFRNFPGKPLARYCSQPPPVPEPSE